MRKKEISLFPLSSEKEFQRSTQKRRDKRRLLYLASPNKPTLDDEPDYRVGALPVVDQAEVLAGVGGHGREQGQRERRAAGGGTANAAASVATAAAAAAGGQADAAGVAGVGVGVGIGVGD